MDTIPLVLLFLATVIGALVTSLLGWLDSGEAFDVKKFTPSVIRGIIAAILVFIGAYSNFVGEVTLFTYLGAFLAGGGFDTVVHYASSITQSKTS